MKKNTKEKWVCPACSSNLKYLTHGFLHPWFCKKCDKVFSEEYINGFWSGYSEGYETGVEDTLKITKKKLNPNPNIKPPKYMKVTEGIEKKERNDK